MKYATFLLEFPNGYHVSNFRLSDAIIKISADVFYSALIHEANDIGGDDLVEEIHSLFYDGKLIISDLFPFIKDELYISKPLALNKFEKSDSDFKKKLKQIEFIPLKYLPLYYNEKLDYLRIKNDLDNMGAFTLSTKIMHKDNGEHEIYNISTYKFNKGNGLYFILAYENEIYLEKFDDIIYSLSFSGVGGKRTLGYGRFEYTYKDIEEYIIPLFNNKFNAFMLINSALPKESEFDNINIQNSAYKIVRKGGFVKGKNNLIIKEAIRKKDLYVFDSGSVFNTKFIGDIYNVSLNNPDPIYRYSKAFFMGVNHD